MTPVFPDNQALEQAAEWYALLRDGQASTQDKQRWQAWLTAKDENQFAWQFVEEISGRFEPLMQTANPRQTADNLSQANHRFKQRRRLLTGLASLTGLGVVTGISWKHQWMPATLMALTSDFRTSTGQQQKNVLADGTQIWLNSDSAVNILYSDSQREIELVTGELFVETAAGDGRPFFINTRYGHLRPLGTRFNVLQKQDGIELAVYQGAVEIRPHRAKHVQKVDAGQQVSFDHHLISQPYQANPAREAWVSGILLAQDQRLADVVAELNRYRRGHINVADEVADLKVYGSFPLSNTDQALVMLSQVLPIEVTETLPWWVSIRSRNRH